MIRIREKSRRIALFVEGDSERGDARRATLPDFFHRWLDPQLPQFSKVGITAKKFCGISNYLDDDPKIAIEKCPNLRLLANDILAIAQALQ
ncbi:MAG TPA: hypothetical protein VKU82_14855 [Planctomycetaceae bacterium]|nr:hypothetical protein [Planctomycetaceae bacterium]